MTYRLLTLAVLSALATPALADDATKLDEVSFTASEMGPRDVQIDAAYVRQRLSDVVEDEDLSRYIL